MTLPAPLALPVSSPAAPAGARPYIGGQAVLEGVMMRAPTSFAVVVRRRDGSLRATERAMHDGRTGLAKMPFFRGIASLVESLKLGSEALRFSAQNYEEDLNAEADAAAKPKVGVSGLGILSSLRALAVGLGLTVFTMATGDGADAAPGEGRSGRGAMFAMLAVVILFFVALPQGTAALVNRGLGLGLEVQSPGFQALTGAFKLLVVVGYLMAIRRVPDIRRVFQYHGAEHKTISTYEANEALTLANARAKTTLHPRCGTTFLVMVALVSIVLFTLLGGLLPRIQTGSALLDNVVFFLEKLPFLPVMAAVTFELQRIFAKYCTTGPLRALLWPGFLVQKITTIEPDDAQLEVALASLRVTLFREQGERANEGGETLAFASYDELLARSHLRAA